MRREVRWLVLLAVIQMGVWPSGAQAQGALITVQPEVAEPGEAVEVRGDGWDNFCAVELTLDYGTGPRLGSADLDHGAFAETVRVPLDVAPGDHQVMATGRLFGDVDTQAATCGGLSDFRAVAPLVVRAPDTAELVLSRDGVDFGAVEVGEAAEERLLATNVGTTTLEGVTVDLEPAGETFAVTDDACTGRTLGPQESCALAVAFRPDATAGARATLLVTSDDLDAPPTATLTGTGVATDPGLVAVPDLRQLPWVLVVLVGLAALGKTRGRSRRWLRSHVRVDPHGSALIQATVDQPGRQPSAAIRLEPHADAGTQSVHEVQ